MQDALLDAYESCLDIAITHGYQVLTEQEKKDTQTKRNALMQKCQTLGKVI